MVDRDTIKPKRVAVIGDAMIDVYIHGHLMDCQDDCQKFVEDSRVECLGGAANAVRSLTNWVSECALFGNRPWQGPRKIRYLANGKIVFRSDDDRMRVGDIAREYAAMFAWNPDVILLSDYDKGVLTPRIISRVIIDARERGIPCVADVKREPGLYKGAILKCNREYANRYYPFENTADVVVTNGAESPIIRHANSAWFEIKASSSVDCINHVGAGDCFAAHLALALAHKFSLVDAATIAHAAGKVYVQYLYNTPPSLQLLQDELESCTPVLH